MPRSTALPRIEVPTEKVSKRLQLDQADVTRIELFAKFYQDQVGGALPDLEQTIIGVVRDALDRNRAFTQYERAQAAAAKGAKGASKAKSAAADGKDSGASADN